MSNLATNIWLYIFYTVSSVAGLLLIKWRMPVFREALRVGDYFSSDLLIVGAGASLYILSFFLWLTILARNDLSVAYPLAVGLTLVCSSVAASWLLD